MSRSGEILLNILWSGPSDFVADDKHSCLVFQSVFEITSLFSQYMRMRKFKSGANIILTESGLCKI